MELKIVWQQSSNDPENVNNLAAIAQWWMSLNGKEVAWCQRLISPGQDLDTINWEPQKFDEKFLINNPQLRGITLYWMKPGVIVEKNTTPEKLVLNNLHQQLYIYPKSQPGVVYRVGFPEIKYQTLELQNPQVELKMMGDRYFLILTDQEQKVIVKSVISTADIEKLQEPLS
ncbi:hypothetical protein [Merismopedia glauca]|uniref:Uncharacterized protein n=1 Tax=Merismopedia glauca CCAP 1448/3 TaxID=1296344 RepID=A0A2T1BXQ0_9CYAN|nr:hypothetical protein [Merismopedia glauca]PSB00790.1 hypothetical protein C7B64_21705 [Merismopedia glauca CCAP 1448/3]